MNSKKFYSPQVYTQFKNEMNCLRVGLLSKTPSLGAYKSKDLVVRLIQKVAEIGLAPYFKYYAGKAKGTNLNTSESLKLGGVELNARAGTLSVSIKLFFQSILDFHLHWLHALFYAVRALISIEQSKGSASIVFGVGVESLFVGGNDLRFIEYCRSGPIEPLRDCQRRIVQLANKKQSTDASFIEYSRFPLFALMLGNPINLSAFVKLFVQHCKMILLYWFAIIRFPALSLLARDFAYHATACHLNNRSLIDSIVITNSNYSAQPLWMSCLPKKSFKTHMVWYAQNTISIAYKNNPVKASLPNYDYMEVDTHWVWTQDYADYLVSLGISSEVKVVGPIVWHLPPEDLHRKKKPPNEVVVSVFDVTPVNNEYAEEIGLYGNYYSLKNMLDFIKSIERLKLELEQSNVKVRVLLKHKRYFNPKHASEYISYVKATVDNGTVELVDSQANIYTLILASDIVVSVPYSSPVYIANSLFVPAVFYDPTQDVFPIYNETEFVSFASGYSELSAIVRQSLNNKIKHSKYNV